VADTRWSKRVALDSPGGGPGLRVELKSDVFVEGPKNKVDGRRTIAYHGRGN
jgi:hypothetical protein